jgi:hypothetical protein
MTTQELQQEAFDRATTGQALTNYPAIFAGFTAKGIPEGEIKPRENVFTFHAWKALGRSVKRGEHGVKVVTFVDCTQTVHDSDDRAGGLGRAILDLPAPELRRQFLCRSKLRTDFRWNSAVQAISTACTNKQPQNGALNIKADSPKVQTTDRKK